MKIFDLLKNLIKKIYNYQYKEKKKKLRKEKRIIKCS